MPDDPHTPAISPSAKVEPRSIIRWRTLACAMLAGGAAMIEIGLWLGWVQTHGSRVPVDGVAAAFAGLALMVRRAALDSYVGFARAVIGTTIVAISVLDVELRGTTLVPVFYAWPLLGAAYLLSRRGLFVAAAAVGVGCAAAFSFRTGPFPLVDYSILLVCGSVVIGTVRVLSESLTASVQALRRRSWTDPLTGLLNRRGFDTLLARQFQRAAFEGRPIASVIMDIDHFKLINDTFGHPAGDAALQRFSALLLESCRAGDIIGRIGGEEFAIVMPGATVEQALARSEDFARRLEEQTEGEHTSMTASIGIAMGTGRPTFTDMLTAADAAVYEAKRNGRNRTVVARPARRDEAAAV